jgi:hypothetical protein
MTAVRRARRTGFGAPISHALVTQESGHDSWVCGYCSYSNTKRTSTQRDTRYYML